MRMRSLSSPRRLAKVGRARLPGRKNFSPACEIALIAATEEIYNLLRSDTWISMERHMKRNGSRTDSVRFYDFISISKLCEGLDGGEGSSPQEGSSPLVHSGKWVPQWGARRGVGGGEELDPERAGRGMTSGFSFGNWDGKTKQM